MSVFARLNRGFSLLDTCLETYRTSLFARSFINGVYPPLHTSRSTGNSFMLSCYHPTPKPMSAGNECLLFLLRLAPSFIISHLLSNPQQKRYIICKEFYPIFSGCQVRWVFLQCTLFSTVFYYIRISVPASNPLTNRNFSQTARIWGNASRSSVYSTCLKIWPHFLPRREPPLPHTPFNSMFSSLRRMFSQMHVLLECISPINLFPTFIPAEIETRGIFKPCRISTLCRNACQ